MNETSQSRPVDANKNFNRASEMLVLLKRLDDAKMPARDVAILYYIIKHPGASRLELSTALGLHAESNVRDQVKRLIKRGLIEDRRLAERRLAASVLHTTDAGVEMWQGLIR